MHQCLQLPEVFHIVCQSLDKGDLFHAALTCRRFTDTALDALWHELTSLIPLRCTLPERVLGTIEGFNDGEELIVPTLLPEDIARLRTVYAPRMRILRLNRTARFDIQPEVLQALHHLLDTSALAPNLTHLDWYSECLDEVHYRNLIRFVHLFLSPSLKHIGLHLWLDYLSPDREIFASIANRYGGLEELQVTWGVPTTITDSGACLTPHVCKFGNLRSLSIPSLAADALGHVASLPGLQDLYLSDIGPGLIPRPSISLAQPLFPALKSLVMVSTKMDGFYGVLRHLSLSTPLGRLSINHTPAQMTENGGRTYFEGLMSKWQAALKMVHDHCNENTLKWIECRDSDYFEPDDIIAAFPIAPDPDDRLETIDITALFKFKNLKTFELSFCHGVWLSKDVLKGIPSAWKSIVFMDLGTSYPPYRLPRVDHEDVVHLVKACPNLWGLGLNFDATQISATPSLLVEKSVKRLVQLKVGSSPIKDAGSVVEFLGIHFPRLFRVDTRKGDDYGMFEPVFFMKWMEVEKGLQQAIVDRRLARKEKAEGKVAS